MTIFGELVDSLPRSRRLMFLLLVSCILVPPSAFSVDTGPVCAIDMGSSNFKLIIGEMKGSKYRQRYYMKDKLSVGTDISKTGVINRAKLNEIRLILRKYLAICDSERILTRSAVATAAFREAKNRREVEEIANSLQLPFEIASEERESQLAYLVGTLGKRNFAVIDNGSRSIELVTYDTDGYQWSVFNLGYEIAFQQFFRSAKTFTEASDKYRQVLAPYLISAGFMKNRDGYIGVEMEHVARNLLSLDRADNVSISLNTVLKKMAALRDTKENEFGALKRAKNVDAILPRIVVLEQTLATFGYREMQVFERAWSGSDRGKRHSTGIWVSSEAKSSKSAMKASTAWRVRGQAGRILQSAAPACGTKPIGAEKGYVSTLRNWARCYSFRLNTRSQALRSTERRG